MKSCCEQAGAPPPEGPVRRRRRYVLYAVLGFVLWQQVHAWSSQPFALR